MANKEKLFSEFQAPTKQEWLDKIEATSRSDSYGEPTKGSTCNPSTVVRI